MATEAPPLSAVALDGREAATAEALWQCCEELVALRWPADPTPRTPEAWDPLRQSCTELARLGVGEGPFRQLMPAAFAAMGRPPLRGLYGHAERLLRQTRAWVSLKRGGPWTGTGPAPDAEALRRFVVPGPLHDPALDGPGGKRAPP